MGQQAHGLGLKAKRLSRPHWQADHLQETFEILQKGSQIVDHNIGTLGGPADQCEKVLHPRPGLLRRSVVIQPKKLKNTAQRDRRTALMELVSISELAKAFTLSPEAFLDAWQFHADREADFSLARMLERSAPDTLLPHLLDRLLPTREEYLPILEIIRERFTPDQRMRIVRQALADKAGDFSFLMDWAGPALGRLPAESLLQPSAWIHLQKVARNQEEHAHQFDALLFGIGLLADQAAAQRLLVALESEGIARIDPRLTLLQLNASLPSPTPQSS